MTENDHRKTTGPASSTAAPALSPAAERALREAEERRRGSDGAAGRPAAEIGGRDGPDPIRYGDWEKRGIVSDF